MGQKQCFRCDQVKPLGDFYRHPRMADGHLNKCKSCTKSDVKKWYRETVGTRREYDAERYQRPERRASVNAQHKIHCQKNPEKYRARYTTSNAIRDRRLLRRPCEVCGGKAEAHHEDYSKPLEVRWLCRKHHRIEHGASIERDITP